MKNYNEVLEKFYCRYGRTMHEIQVLEAYLLEYYAINELISSKINNDEYYEILSNPKKLTLGHLLRKLESKDLLEDEILNQLKIANSFRSFLAHHFCWERDVDFNNESAINSLNAEFMMYNNLFELLMQHFHCKTVSLKKENNLHIEEETGLTDFRKRKAHIIRLRQKNLQK